MMETIKFAGGFLAVMIITSLASSYMFNGSKIDVALGMTVIIGSLFGFYKLCFAPYINL